MTSNKSSDKKNISQNIHVGEIHSRGDVNFTQTVSSQDGISTPTNSAENMHGWVDTENQRFSEQVNVAIFRRMLIKYFDEGELHDLCFDLGIDYEYLPGQGKGNKARELVAHVIRHGRTTELVMLCHRLRPNADWQKVAT